MSQLSPPNTPTTPMETLPAPERPSRGRSIAAVICLVLAGLLTTPAGVAYWGQRTLNDTERYVATVDPLIDSPEVQDAIATKVTAAIEKQVDIEAVLNNVFEGVITERPRLEQLVGPLSAAINSLVEREVRAFIASDEFAELWLQVNIRAQQALQRVLTGEGTGAVTVQGDQLVLDVDEVIKKVKERLVARGLTLVENVPIPDTDRQIVLVQSDQLQQLRTIYAFGNPVAIWMLPVVAVLYLLAFVLAHRRPRMGVLIGAVLAANAVLLALCLSIGRQLFVNQLSGTVFGPASKVFYDTLLVLPRAWAGRPARARTAARRRRVLRRSQQVRHSSPHDPGLGTRERRGTDGWRPRGDSGALGGGQPGLAARPRRPHRCGGPGLGQQHHHGAVLVVPRDGGRGPGRRPGPRRRRQGHRCGCATTGRVAPSRCHIGATPAVLHRRSRNTLGCADAERERAAARPSPPGSRSRRCSLSRAALRAVPLDPGVRSGGMDCLVAARVLTT